MHTMLFILGSILFTSNTWAGTDFASMSFSSFGLSVSQQYDSRGQGKSKISFSGTSKVTINKNGTFQPEKFVPNFNFVLLMGNLTSWHPTPQQLLLNYQLLECSKMASATSSSNGADKRMYKLVVHTDDSIWPLGIGGFDGKSILLMGNEKTYGILSVECFTTAQ